MHRPSLATLTFALLLLAGCRDAKTEVVVSPKKSTKSDGDQTQIALDLFRQNTDLPHTRDALNLLSPLLARSEVAGRMTMKAEDRVWLIDGAKLTAAEVQELEAVDFRDHDASHVASAALFRDAARALEIPGLGELDQAAFTVDWAMRRVLLFEEQFEGVPPAYVLRAGHGSATDRGLVALALLRQFHIEGCLLAAADVPGAPLIGVLSNKNVYLFDTRLGRPVAGIDGKGIATWNDVVKRPELLKASKLTAEQIAKLEARIAAPLEAFAPRMRFLEGLLQGEEGQVGGERLVVFIDIGRVRGELQAAGLSKVGLWNLELRSDRAFTHAGKGEFPRSERFASSLVPWAPVLQRYHDLHVLGELPEEAKNTLLKLTSDLFDKFYREPNEMLVRGKSEALPRRLERIRAVIDEEDFAAGQQETQIQKMAAVWRQRVNEAYLAKLRREPNAAAKVQSLWDEDQYLLYLLQSDVDDIPRQVKKAALTRLVLTATREPLAARINWLFAALSEDRAERAREVYQVQKAAGKETKARAESVRTAWQTARTAWAKYLDRNNFSPAGFVAAVPDLRRGPFHRVDAERVLSLWEHAQRELHQNIAGRLELAKAMTETGQNPAPMLDQLATELQQLLADDTLAKSRAAAPASGLFQANDGLARWSLLQRDWGANGNLEWTLESIRMEGRKK